MPERAAHILSLGQEPSPSPYNGARLPGFLASCLNPVYLEEMNQQKLSREEQPGEELQGEGLQSERPEPAVGTASSGSDPVHLFTPEPCSIPPSARRSLRRRVVSTSAAAPLN